MVPSDPPEHSEGRALASSVGEAPYFLYCSHCRWDSAEVNITFEKPTGLAGQQLASTLLVLTDGIRLAQLQKFEDSAPEALEFERLKEHFEPFLRSSSSSHLPAASSHHLYTSSATVAASAALARDIPGIGKYNPLGRSRAGRDRTANKDEMPEYKSRVETAIFSQLGGSGDDTDVELLRYMETVGEVARVEQRWGNSWTTPLRSR